MTLPRPAFLLTGALLALLLIAPAASTASPGRTAQAAVAAGHAVRGSHARQAKLRHRRTQGRAAGAAAAVAAGVAVKEGGAATSTPSAPAHNPEVLFDGNFDAGFKGWYLQSLSERATLFSSGAFQGTQAARFEVRQGDVEPATG
ncbi:MAG TPA: hypothetical protein VLK56_03825, partial [Solirubrobacterales bacterium]|nr:hypothetical protein [Solirubrobacterales bacterium]